MVDDTLCKCAAFPESYVGLSPSKKKNPPGGDSALMAFHPKGFIAPIRPWAVMFYSKCQTGVPKLT